MSLLGLLVAAFPAVAAPPDDFFESRVRPVLTERRLSCHGPKEAKSRLRLDSRNGVLAGGEGGPVVVPGKPGESRLIQAVRHDGDLRMPTKKLPAAQVAALEKWVALGLPWHALAGLPESEFADKAKEVVAGLKGNAAVNRLVREALPSAQAGMKDVADAYGQLPAGLDR